MLRPSRRLPRALQRPFSPFSRALARAYQPRRAARRLFTLRRRSKKWLGIAGMFSLRLRLWSLSLLVILFLVALLLYFLSSSFRVTSMRVSRDDPRLDLEEVQRLLLPFFGKHLSFLSPHLIERALLTAYPEVASVRIVKRFPGELHVTLYTDPIVAEVQLGSPNDTERSFTPLGGSGAYRYLTARGVYLEYPIPVAVREGDGERLLLKVVDWAVKPAHRQKLLEEKLLQDMQHVRRLLMQSFGHTVRAVTVHLRAREFHMEAEHPARPDGRPPERPSRAGSDGLTLWFDQASSIVQQLDRYREFLRALSPEKITEYVDLRLHDRVVYR